MKEKIEIFKGSESMTINDEGSKYCRGLMASICRDRFIGGNENRFPNDPEYSNGYRDGNILRKRL